MGRSRSRSGLTLRGVLAVVVAALVAPLLPPLPYAAAKTEPLIFTAATDARLGGFITDLALVRSTGVDSPTPTGTVTFTVFGPNDPTCAGPPIFTSANRPLTGGPPATATAEPFLPPATGTYRWVAAYSGDANYSPVTSPCNAPGETSVVSQATPTIVTRATPTASLFQPISDTATVTGPISLVASPTGTVTFTVFGPDNPTCAGDPIFTSVDRPLSEERAISGSFTPTAAGTYRWVAVYSGDANYLPVTSPCNAPNEASVITRARPLLTTVAATSPLSAAPGGTTTDSATLSPPQGLPASAPPPTGSITFNLFGPDDATCAGPPVFTDTVQVNAFGDYRSTAAINQPGTYRWVATYSGDANYEAVSNACGDPAETVTFVLSPTAVCAAGPQAGAIVGTAANDNIVGTADNDVIFGGAGNDYINGAGGNDIICGEAGNDVLLGGEGEDALVGGTGGDSLRGEGGNDRLFGESGTDVLRGGTGNDTLVGGTENDYLAGEDGNDDLQGEAGDDVLDGGAGTNTLDGGADGPNNDRCTNPPAGGYIAC